MNAKLKACVEAVVGVPMPGSKAAKALAYDTVRSMIEREPALGYLIFEEIDWARERLSNLNVSRQ